MTQQCQHHLHPTDTKPKALPVEPTKSPRRDMMASMRPLTAAEKAALPAQDKVANLPPMIAERDDPLCILPGDRRAMNAYNKPMPRIPAAYLERGEKPLGWYRPLPAATAHALTVERGNVRGAVHRVGIDAPWDPDALTADIAREANARQAAAWYARSGCNPLTPSEEEHALQATESEVDEAELPSTSGLRTIVHGDRLRAYPIGPAMGEEYILATDRPSEFVSLRPPRPLGVFDVAETMLYWQSQRRNLVRKLVRRGASVEDARARVVVLARKGKGWEEMEREAQTAEAVLRADGKIPSSQQEAAAKKGKGRKGGRRAASGDAAGPAAVASLPTPETSEEEMANCGPRKRVRAPTAKAREAAEEQQRAVKRRRVDSAFGDE